jgi:hypothetical protein
VFVFSSSETDDVRRDTPILSGEGTPISGGMAEYSLFPTVYQLGELPGGAYRSNFAAKSDP